MPPNPILMVKAPILCIAAGGHSSPDQVMRSPPKHLVLTANKERGLKRMEQLPAIRAEDLSVSGVAKLL